VVAALAVLSILPAELHARSKGRKIASVEPGAAKRAANVVRLENPCESDFELHVVVNPAEGIDHWPVGINLEYRHKEGRGIASRVQTEERATFDAARCERWQKLNWALLDRVLFENKRSERQGLVCRNVAQVAYRVGTKRRTASVCLGSAGEDTVAYAFNRFFSASDHLAE
jgi:hypothetical protein